MSAPTHEHLASLEEIFLAVGRDHDGNHRLKAFLTASGVGWHPHGGRSFICRPSTRIVSLGGIPLVAADGHLALASAPEQPFDVAAYRRATQAMMAHSGMMSYLNPSDRPAEEMFEMLRTRGEMSVAHTVSVGILVAGVSVAVENEFNAQRDLVHLSRITVARTSAQDDPPLVVHNERDVPAFEQALDLARRLRRSTSTTGRDDIEAINLIYPAAKATGFIMTASLRSLMKLMQHQQDMGKEREYRDTLSSIRGNLGFVWPTLFPGELNAHRTTDLEPTQG